MSLDNQLSYFQSKFNAADIEVLYQNILMRSGISKDGNYFEIFNDMGGLIDLKLPGPTCDLEKYPIQCEIYEFSGAYNHGCSALELQSALFDQESGTSTCMYMVSL